MGFGGLALLGAVAVMVLDHPVVLDLYSDASSFLQRVNRLISKLLHLAPTITFFTTILIVLSRLIDLDIPASLSTRGIVVSSCILAEIGTPARCFGLAQARCGFL